VSGWLHHGIPWPVCVVPLFSNIFSGFYQIRLQYHWSITNQLVQILRNKYPGSNVHNCCLRMRTWQSQMPAITKQRIVDHSNDRCQGKLPLYGISIRCKRKIATQKPPQRLPQQGSFDINLPNSYAPTLASPVICANWRWPVFSASSVNVNPVTLEIPLSPYSSNL